MVDMAKFAYARNTITGKVAKIPAHYLGHPVLGKNFVAAEKGDKDYIPELYVAKDAEEFTKSKKSREKEAEPVFTEIVNTSEDGEI